MQARSRRASVYQIYYSQPLPRGSKSLGNRKQGSHWLYDAQEIDVTTLQRALASVNGQSPVYA